MTFGTLTLLGCGDVGPIHEPIDQYSTLIRPVLDQGDVRIAQCERLYTTRGVREPFGRPHSRVAPEMARIFKDCKESRQTAHAVVVSVHWGIHFVPRMIADYQTIAAKAEIEAGADLVLGHHPHVPKAVAVHSGKVCFYSLSNFIMSAPERSPEKLAAFTKRYGVPIDPDYPRLPYGIDSKRSLVAKAKFTTRGIEEVSFIPVLIDKDLRPQALLRTDDRFDDAVNFMEWVSEDFEHRFAVKGNEISVAGI